MREAIVARPTQTPPKQNRLGRGTRTRAMVGWATRPWEPRVTCSESKLSVITVRRPPSKERLDDRASSFSVPRLQRAAAAHQYTWRTLCFILVLDSGATLASGYTSEMGTHTGGGHPPPAPTPWYKENPFWGALSGLLAFSLSGVGFAVTSHPVLGRWLLWLAYPWGLMALWIAINGLAKGKWWRIGSKIAAVTLLALVFWVGDRVMMRPQQDTAVIRHDANKRGS